MPSTSSLWTVLRYSENAAHFAWWDCFQIGFNCSMSQWLDWVAVRTLKVVPHASLNQHCSKYSSSNYLLLIHDEARSLHQNVYQCALYFMGNVLLSKKLNDMIVSHDSASSSRTNNKRIHGLVVVCRSHFEWRWLKPAPDPIVTQESWSQLQSNS